MSSNTVLVLISGASCTGKTTLARRLADELHWPLIYKDGIKERLFDVLGWTDRAWSKKLGDATYAVLDYFVEEQMRAGRSVVVESNFRPAYQTAIIQGWRRKYPFTPVQIYCYADHEVLVERLRARSVSNERHPGHQEHTLIEELAASLANQEFGVMDIGGLALTVDTTDFSAIDYAELLAQIRAISSSPHS